MMPRKAQPLLISQVAHVSATRNQAKMERVRQASPHGEHSRKNRGKHQEGKIRREGLERSKTRLICAGRSPMELHANLVKKSTPNPVLVECEKRIMSNRCRFTHDTGKYLEAKDRDIKIPPVSQLTELPPFGPDMSIVEKPGKKYINVDFSTRCPVFHEQGDCRCVRCILSATLLRLSIL